VTGKRRGLTTKGQPSPANDHQAATTPPDRIREISLSLSDADKAVPRRYSRGYFLHLDSLSLPDGLKFWALAPVDRRPPKYTESVWALDEQRQFQQLVIDTRTGEGYVESRSAA
jgi:hypothetical protein